MSSIGGLDNDMVCEVYIEGWIWSVQYRRAGYGLCSIELLYTGIMVLVVMSLNMIIIVIGYKGSDSYEIGPRKGCLNDNVHRIRC